MGMLYTCPIPDPANDIVGSCASVAAPDQSMLDETKVWRIAFSGCQTGSEISEKRRIWNLLAFMYLKVWQSGFVLIVYNACFSFDQGHSNSGPILDGSSTDWIGFHPFGLRRWNEWCRFTSDKGLNRWTDKDDYLEWGPWSGQWRFCLIHSCHMKWRSPCTCWERQLKYVWTCKSGQRFSFGETDPLFVLFGTWLQQLLVV